MIAWTYIDVLIVCTPYSVRRANLCIPYISKIYTMPYASVVTPLGLLYDLDIKRHRRIENIPLLQPQWIGSRDVCVTENGRILQSTLIKCHLVRTVLKIEGNIRFKRVFAPDNNSLIGWTQDNKLVKITKENDVYTATVIVEDAIHVGDLTDTHILPVYSESKGLVFYVYNEADSNYGVIMPSCDAIQGEVIDIKQGVIYTTEMIYAVYSYCDRREVDAVKIYPIEVPSSATVIDAVSFAYETILITNQGMYRQHRVYSSEITRIGDDTLSGSSWIKCIWKTRRCNIIMFDVIDSEGDLYLLDISGDNINFEFKFNIPIELLIDVRMMSSKSARNKQEVGDRIVGE